MAPESTIQEEELFNEFKEKTWEVCDVTLGKIKDMLPLGPEKLLGPCWMRLAQVGGWESLLLVVPKACCGKDNKCWYWAWLKFRVDPCCCGFWIC